MGPWLVLLGVLVALALVSAVIALDPRLAVALGIRHPDGTRHHYVEVPSGLGRHACEPMSYCHHWLGRCECGDERVLGYAVEEVR